MCRHLQENKTSKRIREAKSHQRNTVSLLGNLFWDGGGIGQGDHFLRHKFIKRTFKHRVNYTKQILNADRWHQASRKAAPGLRKEILNFCFLVFVIIFFFLRSDNFIVFIVFFLFYFIFKLYKIVLVLPNIKMNPPQVYMCSPSWTLLSPPSPYHPSGSSQCTSPKHPVSCINICFIIKEQSR